MNIQLVEALVEAVKALPLEDRALFESRLSSADALVLQSRGERIKQQDDYLKEIFPTYEPINHA
ncbi:MAG: hypothetical protein SFT94_10755 [Pseudanabaenaceae cyanobacterium bins.68]|nr:hypothetical protein [Pseudanabaenaceae cyanobacterium bins.68]